MSSIIIINQICFVTMMNSLSDDDEEIIQFLMRRNRPRVFQNRIDHINKWNDTEFFRRLNSQWIFSQTNIFSFQVTALGILFSNIFLYVLHKCNNNSISTLVKLLSRFLSDILFDTKKLI